MKKIGTQSLFVYYEVYDSVKSGLNIFFVKKFGGPSIMS
jgi:hypothetical protein